MRRVYVILSLLIVTSSSFGQAKFTQKPDYSKTIREMPDAMKRAGFEQRHNAQLPMDTIVRNEKGESITFGSLFDERPVVLTYVYYNCPMLCNVILNSLADTLKEIPFQLGRDYQIITLSFDHTEDAALAAAKKKVYLEYLGASAESAGSWHFLTADESSITNLTSAAGFTFAWETNRNEFAHASGIMLATPAGRLSHYFFGVMYEPSDVRLGLVDASAGKIGSPLDKVKLMFCYHYDPSTGAYSLAIFRILKVGGILTIAGLGIFITTSLRQEKRQRLPHAAPA